MIRTRKEGRVRYCELEERRLAVVGTWLDQQRVIWEGRADRLDCFVAQKRKELE